MQFEPTTFGEHYELVEHIATGGMAEIYRARYAGIEGFSKDVVIKVLRREFAARPDVVAMFLEEARVAASLSHKNVVDAYDLGETATGEYYIAMELLRGQELVAIMRQAHRREQALPLAVALAIVMQACEGLQHVHTKTDAEGQLLGLVHRDINPTNIHVGYDGVTKILDFGIAATRASAVARAGQVVGKLAYMAPEQLQGQTVDARADVFSLGVVLYELTLARRLFRGPKAEVSGRILSGDIPPPTFVDPAFPPAVEAVIMRALEVDPAERYRDAEAMFAELEAFVRTEDLGWSERKIGEFVTRLFTDDALPLATARTTNSGDLGEAAARKTNSRDDEFADLDDDPLDFAAFDRVPVGPPAWAMQIDGERDSEDDRKGMTIGNLEALVQQGRFDQSDEHEAHEDYEVDIPPRPHARSASAPDPGDSFAHGSVLDERALRGSIWLWILGFLGLCAGVVLAYTLLAGT